MKVYPDEKKELESLASSFDMKGKGLNAEALPKPIILLQTYLKRFYEFKEVYYILEIALHRHLVKTTHLALNYIKLVEIRVYPGSSPLWQFTFESNKQSASKTSSGKFYDNTETYLSSDLFRKIHQTNLSLNDIISEEKKILSQVLGTSVDRVKDIYNREELTFNINIEAKPITRTILNITINILPKFKWKKRWNHISETFWTIVDDGKEIILYEYFILTAKNEDKKEKETVITFSVPFQIDVGAKEASVDKIYSINIISAR